MVHNSIWSIIAYGPSSIYGPYSIWSMKHMVHIMEKEMGKERANGKVWGGIGVSFGKDWVDGRLWVRLGVSERWV